MCVFETRLSAMKKSSVMCECHQRATSQRHRLACLSSSFDLDKYGSMISLDSARIRTMVVTTSFALTLVTSVNADVAKAPCHPNVLYIKNPKVM